MVLRPDRPLRYLGLDLTDRSRRRWLITLTVLAYFALIFGAEGRSAFPSEHFVDWCASAALVFFSVAGYFGPLGYLDGAYIRAGRRIGDKVMLGSLDDWARYRHNAPFDALPPDQQQALLRTYRVGNYLLPWPPPDYTDPRLAELALRNAASHRSLLFLIPVLIYLAVQTRPLHHPTELFLQLAATAACLPNIILLWTLEVSAP